MSGASPKWKRPSEVMLKRKKRLNIQQKPGLQNDKRTCEDKINNSLRPLPKSVKRRNPFSCSASKRPALSESSNLGGPDTPMANDLFKALEEKCQETPPALKDSQIKVLDRLSEACIVKDDHLVQNLPINDQAKREEDLQGNQELEKPKYFDYYPVDWSLRTKARFISNKPFNWCCQMPSADECSGTVAFVKGASSRIQECENPHGNPDSKAQFKQLTCYWMHPSLPWFRLFPRISADSKAGKPSSVLQDDTVQASLMSDWYESLTSVFQHLRCRLCPYFYLCCHHLTVLFRAAGVAGHPDIHALITPTSRGFRNVLKEEGIEVSMPLNPLHKSSRETEEVGEESLETKDNLSSNDQDQASERRDTEDKVDDDDIDDADDAASSWLKDLGLDAAKFKSLDPKKIKLQREGYKHIDQRPESVVLVEGSDVQALFNYLLNSSTLVSPTGWQAGIPPTIIAPTAFKGATLKTHQVKSGLVRQAVGEQQAYSLEVLGPIMPYCLDGLLNLFSHTQQSFTASFSVHEPSTALNGLPLQTEESESDISCEKAAVPALHLRNITKNFNLTKFALREVSCEAEKFAWLL